MDQESQRTHGPTLSGMASFTRNDGQTEFGARVVREASPGAVWFALGSHNRGVATGWGGVFPLTAKRGEDNPQRVESQRRGVGGGSKREADTRSHSMKQVLS